MTKTGDGGPGSEVPSGTPKLVARVHEGMGWIVFNHPRKHNAVSHEMYEALARVMHRFSAAPEVRVVILRGAGEKAFVSGADISQFSHTRSTREGVRAAEAVLEAANRALLECPKPTIAMIRGYCMGGGLGLAAACDLRIAADDARFAIPAAKLGVGYGYAGLKRLSDLVGPAYTAEIFYTARQFDAQEALEMRLVNRVRPAGDLERYVTESARAMTRNAPLTLRAVKRCLIEIAKAPGERDERACKQAVEACFASADFVEGRTAFMEKRPPAFTGA